MLHFQNFRKGFTRLFVFTAGLSFLLASAGLAGEIAFIGKTDKDPLSYQSGEEMVFSITVTEDGNPVAGKELVWTRRGDDGKTEKGEAVSSETEPLVIKTSIDVPGFVYIQVAAKDANGVPDGWDVRQFNGGAGVLLDQIKGVPEPADFDEFWARQKVRLAEVPMRADRTPVDSPDDQVNIWDVHVDCLGGPVTGYLCIPKDAAPGSLPVEVSYHGYNVATSFKYPKRDTITFDINGHPIENGREPEFYKELFRTTYKSYGFDKTENANPETCFWNGMMMRVMRSLEFVKSLPEWNGKDLTVSGGSQGGFQCLSAAALDHDVTYCNAVVPWFCNLAGATEQGRIPSNFMVPWVPELGYYDTVNQAKRIQCKTKISVGLGDYVCPPSGEMALYNNMTCPVLLEFFQGRTHGYFKMKDATISVLEK